MQLRCNGVAAAARAARALLIIARPGGILRSATPDSAPISMPTSIVVVLESTSNCSLAVSFAAQCGCDILKQQLVLFCLREHILVLRGVELRGVFGRDNCHWFLCRLRKRRHYRTAIVAFPREKDGIIFRIEGSDAFAAAIEAVQ